MVSYSTVRVGLKFLRSHRRRLSLLVTYKRPGEQFMLLNFTRIRCCKGRQCGVHGHQRWNATRCSLLGWGEWELVKNLGMAVCRVNDDCEIWGAGGSVLEDLSLLWRLLLLSLKDGVTAQFRNVGKYLPVETALRPSACKGQQERAGVIGDFFSEFTWFPCTNKDTV